MVCVRVSVVSDSALGVWLLFALLSGGDFIRWDNQRLMLLQTAVVGTAAIGATLIIISGGIDLSVGSSIALGTVVVALLLTAGFPPLLAALGGIGAGMLCGAAVGAMVIGHGSEITPENLPFDLRDAEPSESPGSLKEMERLHITRVLGENDWNISKSARVLEIDRQTLYNKIEKYGLKAPGS